MYVFIFKSIIFFSKLLLVDESAKGIIMICMYIRATYSSFLMLSLYAQVKVPGVL